MNILTVGFVLIVLVVLLRRPGNTVVQEVHISVPAIPHQLIMALVPDAEWDRTKNAVSFAVNEFEFMIDNEDQLWYKTRIQSMTTQQEKWRKGRIEDFVKFLHPIAVERLNDSLTNQASQFNKRLAQQNNQQGRKQLQSPKVQQNNNQQKRSVCSPDKAKAYWKQRAIFEKSSFLLPSGYEWEQIDDASDINDGKWIVVKS